MKLWALFALSVATVAAYEDYCPWWPEAERRRVKLIAAYEDMITKGQVIRRGEFSITNDNCAMRVRGIDWTLDLPDACTFRAAYVFDFDGNGRKDLLLRLYTGATGVRPAMELIAVLIGGDGQPRLSRWYSFFADPVVTDFDGDGRYEFIDSGYGGSKRDKHHYWSFVLYEARDAEWHRIDGKHGAIESPQYTWFTHRGNRKPVQFAPGEEPETGDLSTAPETRGLIAKSIRWRYGHGGPHRIEFSNGGTCKIHDGADAILARGTRYEWTKPSEWLLKQGPLDVVMHGSGDDCYIGRVVVRPTKAGAK